MKKTICPKCKKRSFFLITSRIRNPQSSLMSEAETIPFGRVCVHCKIIKLNSGYEVITD